MRRLFLMLALLVLPTLAACGSDGPTSVEDTKFAPELGVDLSTMTRTSNGLYYKDLTVGTGAVVQSGQTVSAYYKGWFPSGRSFEQLQPPSGAYPFILGVGAVIKGWDQGIPGMKVGGKRLLVIPSDLAYGSAGRGSIPPNSILVFEVEITAAR
ncbi:FKBP-type peptidyl-prolyl cis-trans isomerase [Longimicrobium sp.]|uniref:FKBP-type peptidyl-prolyl cis-trans isomerase n=1 Tax=Longimicrobium sp. TaxID=2029185 RepID=UPI002E2FB906|nr:FKBP-type peptidyl-prolyl cis-trans isomerase [Longimicrobium sp.]HEX6040472.1 FKBP-type peptidyl-prolyl cis-trans isomerase [Longimicrobium sp.]